VAARRRWPCRVRHDEFPSGHSYLLQLIDKPLRESSRRKPYECRSLVRSSAVSRRYASLHLLLQNLLPHQRYVTIPKRPPQWSHTWACLIIPSHNRGRPLAMMPSHDLGVLRRQPQLCGDRRSTCGRSRRAALRLLAGSSPRLAPSTTRRTIASGVSYHSPRRISWVASRSAASFKIIGSRRLPTPRRIYSARRKTAWRGLPSLARPCVDRDVIRTQCSREPIASTIEQIAAR